MSFAERGSDHFRRVLSHVPTSVVVVAGMDSQGNPRGLCVGSFTSVSLAPPMILFCVAKSSKTWPLIERGGKFCVNVLGEQHDGLGRTFAGPDADRFAGLDWTRSALGSPRITGVVAWLDCTLTRIHDGGDHLIVTAVVDSLDHADPESGQEPLVFHRGRFATVKTRIREMDPVLR